MNGRKKSVKPVVATKSPNKAGAKPAVEGMEPRSFAKGKSANNKNSLFGGLSIGESEFCVKGKSVT